VGFGVWLRNTKKKKTAKFVLIKHGKKRLCLGNGRREQKDKNGNEAKEHLFQQEERGTWFYPQGVPVVGRIQKVGKAKTSLTTKGSENRRGMWKKGK